MKFYDLDHMTYAKKNSEACCVSRNFHSDWIFSLTSMLIYQSYNYKIIFLKSHVISPHMNLEPDVILGCHNLISISTRKEPGENELELGPW